MLSNYLFYNKALSVLSAKMSFFRRLKWTSVMQTDEDKFYQKLNDLLFDSERIDLRRCCSDDKLAIMNVADRALTHTYIILGEEIQFGIINWHVDFKNNYTWKKGKYFTKYKTTIWDHSSDVKYPWELSRCHHLLALGSAYLLCGSEKYAKEIIHEISWWIDDNPYVRSINWTCSMEVAIRAVNWLYALCMIKGSCHITNEFINKVNRSLYLHGVYIYDNLEKQFPYSANHYVANIAGLSFLGAFFSDTKHGKKWLNFATQEFLMEVRSQVLPSGVHFERSISYHRLTTELFFYTYLLLRKIDCNVEQLDVSYRLRSMIDFTFCYTMGNGLAPLMGDNDDGRFLPFVVRNFSDHKYLYLISNYVWRSKRYPGDTLLLADLCFLLPSSELCRENVNSEVEVLCSKIYGDAGFAIINTSEFFFMFSNTGISRYYDVEKKVICTHTHFDALSFVYSWKGDEIFVDPGSYQYTGNKSSRDEFRSTNKHNTISIDGVSPYEFMPKHYFGFSNAEYRYKQPLPIYYRKLENGHFISSGFVWKLHDKEVAHKRKAVVLSNGLIIQDTVDSLVTFSAKLTLCLADTVVIRHIDSNVLLLELQSGEKFILEFESGADFIVSVDDTFISRSYGVLCKSKIVSLDLCGYNGYDITTKLIKYD